MASKFDVYGIEFTILSWIPDEVVDAFNLIYTQAYAKGLEAGRAEATKAPAKPKKAKAPIERAE
ncbi:hypothetical protein [Nonomuraea sp. NPDC049141]|uniref:hypothetical protein n=1 Tax=Nonomuraea sp. NPDC049141 TaxID=3155500 RepID=UPI0033E18816